MSIPSAMFGHLSHVDLIVVPKKVSWCRRRYCKHGRIKYASSRAAAMVARRAVSGRERGDMAGAGGSPVVALRGDAAF